MIALLGLGTSLIAQAEIFKLVDADGQITYSNVPMKGAIRLNLEPATAAGSRAGSGPKASTMAPSAGFPRVDQNTQKARDSKRMEILNDELVSEHKALENAKRSLAEGQENPETFKGNDGKTYRNVSKFNEKIQNLQRDVNLHQKNIEMLEKELGSNK